MIEIDQYDKELLRKAYDRANAASEIMRFLSEFFQYKYKLDKGDQITPDGKIIKESLHGTSDLP